MTEQGIPKIFEDIVIFWGDEKNGRRPEYRIPSDKVMKAIAIVEEHVTLAELGAVMQTGRIPLAKLSGAYAGLLRYAGCSVTPEEVYAQLFGESNSGLSASNISNVITSLLLMMMPSSVLKKAEGEEASTDKDAGKRKGRAKAS